MDGLFVCFFWVDRKIESFYGHSFLIESFGKAIVLKIGMVKKLKKKLVIDFLVRSMVELMTS